MVINKSHIFTWYATASYLGRAYQIKITELVEPVKFELFLCFLFFNMVFGRNYVACVSIVIYSIKRIAQLPLISAGLSSVQKSHSIIFKALRTRVSSDAVVGPEFSVNILFCFCHLDSSVFSSVL